MKLDEKYTLMGHNYSEISHIHEFDSDIHAANKVCHHIIHYWKKLESEYQTQSILEQLMSLTLSSAFFFWISEAGGIFTPIYYNENSHPLVRATYIAPVFIDHLQKYYPKINQRDFVVKIIEIANSLSLNHRGIEIENTYKSILWNEHDNIIRYIGKLINHSVTIPYLTINTVHKH